MEINVPVDYSNCIAYQNICDVYRNSIDCQIFYDNLNMLVNADKNISDINKTSNVSYSEWS